MGTIELDLMDAYYNKDHEHYRRWGALSAPDGEGSTEDPNGGGSMGSAGGHGWCRWGVCSEHALCGVLHISVASAPLQQGTGVEYIGQ